MFTNRQSFKLCLTAQLAFFDRQRQFMIFQHNQIISQINDMEGAESASDSEEVGSGIVATKKAQRKIQMSEPNRAEFEAITTEEWSNFIKACGSKKRLSVKEITILRIYATFIQLSNLANCVDDDDLFLSEFSQMLSKKDTKDICKALDPEIAFNVSEPIKAKVKELLVNLQSSRTIDSDDEQESNSESCAPEEAALKAQVKTVVEVLTNVIFEVLQQVNVIPNMMVEDLKQEAEELKNVAVAFEGIKNNLIDFKNLIP